MSPTLVGGMVQGFGRTEAGDFPRNALFGAWGGVGEAHCKWRIDNPLGIFHPSQLSHPIPCQPVPPHSRHPPLPWRALDGSLLADRALTGQDSGVPADWRVKLGSDVLGHLDPSSQPFARPGIKLQLHKAPASRAPALLPLAARPARPCDACRQDLSDRPERRHPAEPGSTCSPPRGCGPLVMLLPQVACYPRTGRRAIQSLVALEPTE